MLRHKKLFFLSLLLVIIVVNFISLGNVLADDGYSPICSPTTIDFGNVVLNNTATENFTITSDSSHTFSITEISLSDGLVGYISVPAGPFPTSDNLLSYTGSLSFTPSYTGAYGGTVTVYCDIYNASGGIPQGADGSAAINIAITGNGVQPTPSPTPTPQVSTPIFSPGPQGVILQRNK